MFDFLIEYVIQVYRKSEMICCSLSHADRDQRLDLLLGDRIIHNLDSCKSDAKRGN